MTFDAEIERPRRGVWFRARAVYPGEMPLKPRAAQRTQCAGAWPPTGSAANKTWIGRVAFVRTRPQGPGFVNAIGRRSALAPAAGAPGRAAGAAAPEEAAAASASAEAAPAPAASAAPATAAPAAAAPVAPAAAAPG